MDGEQVTWKLQCVLDVKEVLADSLEDGTEVYSAFLDRKEADALMRQMREPLGA